MKILRLAAVAISLMFVITTTGCVTTSHKSVSDLSLRENTESILLMPMDIELSALTAGGVLEPNAAWTAEAIKLVHAAISEKIASEKKAQIIDLDSKEEQLDAEQRKLQTQLIKLHEAVGQTILTHKYIPLYNLPNKTDKFDWTLGEEAKFLKDKFGSDYALFVYMRDSYATAGRVAVIFVGAALGIGVPGGQQVGFASLVDLNSGEVVWFNRLIRGVGDLRNKDGADNSVEILLVDFPT
jgi:hypothetical protein